MKLFTFLSLFTTFSTLSLAQGEATEAEFKTYSKFDFIPGEELIFFDNFSTGSIGDFPASWNTNGTGELVTINGLEGKWMKLATEIRYRPDINIKAFPDNYTIEFDMIYTAEDMDGSNNFIELNLFSAANAYQLNLENNSGAMMRIEGTGIYTANMKDGSSGGLESVVEKRMFVNKVKKTIHFSIWVQKQRGRLYIDETKVLDIPLLLPEDAGCNAFSFMPGIYGEDERNIYISNIRLAVGAPDMRSKLLTEGKLVTRGILFDVNSDKIKAESYGTLKEISKVLAENPDVKVKIIGHTDSDGSDVSNLDLSKRRAASVKSSLNKDFGIDLSRMETDGKGEGEPLSPNTTTKGMANNRRVEFIKL